MRRSPFDVASFLDLPVAVDTKHEDARVNFANIQVRFAGHRPKSIALSIEHTPVDGLVDELPLLVVFGCRRKYNRQLSPLLVPLLPLLAEIGEGDVVLSSIVRWSSCFDIGVSEKTKETHASSRGPVAGLL